MAAELTRAQHAALAKHWQVFRRHYPVGGGIWMNGHDGNCFECRETWPCSKVAPLLVAAFPPPPPPAMKPGRWWRVLDDEGDLWCETSVEGEARAEMKYHPTYRLQNLFEMVDEREWRDV